MWHILQDSSMLGVSHSGKSFSPEHRQYKRGIFWSFVTLSLWGTTFFHVYQVITDHLRYPVFTSITIESPKSDTGYPFPTVVLCNRNPVKCSELFKLYFKRNDLWAASGCAVGPQVEDFVRKVTTEYSIRKGFPINPKYLEKDASGLEPLIVFWAHSYMDSNSVLDMLVDER